MISSSLLQAPGSRLPSAEDITEYILLTGDQDSVVNLIEGLVNNGKVSAAVREQPLSNLRCRQMSEEQALVYVETIKAMLESVEKEEEEEMKEMLLQRKLEEMEREEALRNLLRRGEIIFAKAALELDLNISFCHSGPQTKEENMYRQLRGRL